jgi:hypothetical protein
MEAFNQVNEDYYGLFIIIGIPIGTPLREDKLPQQQKIIL